MASWSSTPTPPLWAVTGYVVWMCNIGIVCSIHILFAPFLKIPKEKEKKGHEMKSQEAQWVIGSCVDGQAAWVQQDRLAALSEPG